MALGSCYTCIKYLMFAFNFIFWLLGCAILGVGIWLRVDESSVEYLAQSSQVETLHSLAYALIAIGFVIMLIGFLGCCGAIRESQCMLTFFFIFLFIIFATLLGFGIWAAVAKDSFRDVVHDILKDGVDNYKNDEAKRKLMDSVQERFECCGYDQGKLDYNDGANPTYQTDDGIKATVAICSHDKPCTEPLYDWFKERLVVVAGIAIGIAVVMILGMIFSMVLCCAIRDAM